MGFSGAVGAGMDCGFNMPTTTARGNTTRPPGARPQGVPLGASALCQLQQVAQRHFQHHQHHHQQQRAVGTAAAADVQSQQQQAAPQLFLPQQQQQQQQQRPLLQNAHQQYAHTRTQLWPGQQSSSWTHGNAHSTHAGAAAAAPSAPSGMQDADAVHIATQGQQQQQEEEFAGRPHVGHSVHIPAAPQQRHSRSSRRSKRVHSRDAAQQQQQQRRASSSSGEPAAAGKALTAAISKCESWQLLQSLLAAEAGRMNHIHAAALLARTSRLVSFHQLGVSEADAFGAFFVDALQLAFRAAAQGAAGPRELSSMLWAVARMGLHPGGDWLSAYLAASACALPRMNAQDLGLLGWSLARFRHAPAPAFTHELLAAAHHQLAATSCEHGSGSSGSALGAQGFDGQGLSNLLWALAVLDVQPSRLWLDAAVQAGEVLLQRQQLQPQGLAVLLWAVAKLGHRPPQAWLQAAADAAAVQLRQFKPAELAMLCHALARLHYQQQHHHHQQQPPLLQQVQDAVEPHMHCLRFAEASNLLWGLAVLGQQPAPAWLDALVARLQETLHDADAQAIACACYALAKLQHQPQDAWWPALWAELPRVLGAAGAEPGTGSDSSNSSSSSGIELAAGMTAAAAQSQATLLLSLAKLGARLPPSTAACLLQASQQLLEARTANGAEVAGLAMAAAKLRLSPPAAWLAALEGLFEAQLLHSCHMAAEQQQQQEGNLSLLLKPLEVANTLLSIARLRYVPRPAVVAAVQEFARLHEHLLTDADRQQLSRALMSLTDRRNARAAAAAEQLRVARLAATRSPHSGAACCTCASEAEVELQQQQLDEPHATAAAAAAAAAVGDDTSVPVGSVVTAAGLQACLCQGDGGATRHHVHEAAAAAPQQQQQQQRLAEALALAGQGLSVAAST